MESNRESIGETDLPTPVYEAGREGSLVSCLLWRQKKETVFLGAKKIYYTVAGKVDGADWQWETDAM